MSKVWHARCSCVPSAESKGMGSRTPRNLSDALPALQATLADQRMGRQRLEICPLPTLLSAGSDHLE